VVLTSLAFVYGQIWIGLQSLFRSGRSQKQQVAKVNDLKVGETILFHYLTELAPCLLTRQSEENFVAFSSQCTHLMCPVRPEPDDDRLHCPCHEGYFDAATGRPLAGPPRRPLPLIKLEVKKGIVYATAVELRIS